jgi:hypothetical protein
MKVAEGYVAMVYAARHLGPPPKLPRLKVPHVYGEKGLGTEKVEKRSWLLGGASV